MLCPNCETENREGAKFCDECGFPLTGAIAARAAEAAAAGVYAEAADEGPAHEDPVPPEAEYVQDADETAALEPLGDSPAFDGGDPVDFDESLPDDAEDLPDGEPADGGEEARADRADMTQAIDADFAGLEQIGDEYGERVVGPDYQEPQANWRDGHTMQMPRIEGDEAPRSRDFLASATTKQNKGGRIAIIAVVSVVLVAAIVAFATYQMQLWGGKAIPDVRGMTEADATSVLEDSGFAVRSTQVKSDDTEGLVLITDPTAGSRIDEGDEIVIHIATARTIPEVVGKSEKEAKELFEEAGYENVTYSTERSDEKEGTVLSVSPEAGTRAKSSLAVTVKIAEPFVVPDTSAVDLGGAIAAIEQAGLPYDVYYVDTTDYADGSVIGTNPEAGAKVTHDTVVVINVARARGPQLVQLTRDMLSPGSTVTIDGVSYEIESLGNVEYQGNDVVAFTLTGRPFTYFMGQYIVLEATTVSGHVTWTSDNGLAGISG